MGRRWILVIYYVVTFYVYYYLLFLVIIILIIIKMFNGYEISLGLNLFFTTFIGRPRIFNFEPLIRDVYIRIFFIICLFVSLKVNNTIYLVYNFVIIKIFVNKIKFFVDDTRFIYPLTKGDRKSMDFEFNILFFVNVLVYF